LLGAAQRVLVAAGAAADHVADAGEDIAEQVGADDGVARDDAEMLEDAPALDGIGGDQQHGTAPRLFNGRRDGDSAGASCHARALEGRVSPARRSSLRPPPTLALPHKGGGYSFGAFAPTLLPPPPRRGRVGEGVGGESALAGVARQ